MYTKEQLKQQLKDMGILPTDTVLIHTSFKAVGGVEGGPDAFIDAFREYLSDGLFIVPTHTWANVGHSQPVYDVRETVPCIGLVPRTAAFRADGIRSLHPTHSVWASGKGAAEFVRGEENAMTPAPIGGAWWKLSDVGAKILLIGVAHGRNTFIHAVDEMACLHDRLNPEPFDVTILDKDGVAHTHSYQPHGRTGSENFDNFEPAFLHYGAVSFGKLGDATVRVCDAAKIRDTVLRVYAKTHENLCMERKDIPEEFWK